MSGNGETTTVQKADPWIGQQPYLRRGYGQAETNLNNNLTQQYYGGRTVADDSALRSLALGGDTLTPGARDELGRTISGDYLGGGEFMRAYGNDIMDSVDSRFAMGGRSGSGYQSKVLGSSLGDAAARLYDSERNRQMQAIGMAPQLDSARYADAMMVNNLDQRQIDADMARWNWEQSKDDVALQNYMSAINGNVGGATTTTAPSSSGGLLGGIGGASAGAGLASALGVTGPWGWGLAGLGALAGMM